MNTHSRQRASSPARRAAASAATKREPLGRQAWLEAARQALMEEGTAGVEVNKLAKRLSSSRGGFYWFFKGRQELLDELASYWAETSTAPFEAILQQPGHNGVQEYLALIDLW